MPVSLHHLHFSAPLDALLEVKAFYSQLLDLQEGPRPAFKNPGFWLYAGNHPLIHMSDAGASCRSTDASATTIGHVAFACSDIAAMQAKLVAMQIPFERKTVPALASDPPNTQQIQLFLTDPLGNKVELNFVELNGGEVSSAKVRRKLPIGIQTFAEIIAQECYYVDKTAQIAKLIEDGKYYFLSRPRRFGKSLLLDTIKELFSCNADLFRGLFIHERWDWTRPSPVIRISFNNGGLLDRKSLEVRMLSLLQSCCTDLAVPFPETQDPVQNFSEVIRLTARQYKQRVVILIDEYDKPILDQIHDSAIALAMRECLKGFYSVIKGSDEHISFALITGVSKFSKVSLFSGLNNLRDITVSADFATICGYTDADIDRVFAPELLGLDRQEIKRWYNGYNWLGTPVYNPHGVLSLFSERKYRSWWFESATPTFLIKLLTERQAWLPQLGNLTADADMLSSFDVDAIPTTALMFQTGYLTIDEEVLIGGNYYYRMRFPNREVEQSLYGSILRLWTADSMKDVENKQALYLLLEQNNLAGLKNLVHAFFSSIPHQWFVKNTIAQYEGYYASVFYAYFVAAGLSVIVEDATNFGRIDMTVKLQGRVYLFEFKVVAGESEGKALQQIKDKQYADKYRADAQEIYLIGIEFSKLTRNVLGFEFESA